MPSRVRCWLGGHAWLPWQKRTWQNLFGVQFQVRFCDQCGAMDRRPA